MEILSFRVIILFVGILFILIMALKINKMIKLEERIGKYSIYPISIINNNLSEYLEKKYNHIISKIESKFYQNKKINKISNSYNKYIVIGDDISGIRLIINKLLIGIIFLVLVIISFILRGKSLGIIGYIFSFIIGYYIYDIYLIISNKIKKKKIKNDILRSVIIMNNAFKAGKSIMQSVHIVSQELSYPIKGEFEKIYQDMLYGLSSDVVFERFAKRVNIEEVRYISASLSILNKTGGNIVNVFNSIEKTLIDKQRLETELKNATSASNLVTKILIAIPFIFTLLIYAISPDYFSPLTSSFIGYIILGLIILIFILYVYILNKITKVGV